MSAPNNPGFESYKHIVRQENSAGRVMPGPKTCIVLTNTPVSDISSVKAKIVAQLTPYCSLSRLIDRLIFISSAIIYIYIITRI